MTIPGIRAFERVASLLISAVLTVASALAAPTENHVLPSLPAARSVQLDGDLSEWDCSGAIVMADDLEHPGHMVRVSSMYDAAGLYLAFEFDDPTPMVNHIDPKTSPGRAWCGDAVQLRICTAPDGVTPGPMQILHIDGYWYTEGKQPAAYVVYADMSPGGQTAKIIEHAVGQGVELAFRPLADGQGYVQEMRLDWTLLRPGGKPYESGQSLRMAVEALWGDARYKEQPGTRVTDLLNPKLPERQMLWTNPRAFGSVQLVARGNLPPSDTASLWAKRANSAHSSPKQIDATPVQEATPKMNRPCLQNDDPVARQLNQWFAEGSAAGNTGDYYDNRDRNHSAITLPDYPQLRLFGYTPDQLQENQDYGLFAGVRPHVTFGNSSTSSAADQGGSNPRHAMMQPTGMSLLYAQYRGNNLYVYPGHHDYLAGHNGHPFYGDLYPLNSPYLLISKGSSGSDIPFLNAALHTVAALRPDVKRLLIREGLLLPTVQAILRASNTQVVSPEDYFSGKAHPVVFDGNQLDELKMVQAAHALTPQTLPPLAQVRIVREDREIQAGTNAPEGALTERLCDTPGVIGRVHRRWDRTLRMTVSAADSYDRMGRPLTFRWVLLQGDPQRVHIEPGDDGREAQLTIGWHDRYPTRPGSSIELNRVDIGVFVSCGTGWSAPAFVCVDYPDNELRTYDEHDQLVDVFYGAVDTSIGYSAALVLPAEGTPPYDVRDWTALLKAAAGEGDGLPQRLFKATLNDTQRASMLDVRRELETLLAKVEARPERAGMAQGQDVNRRREGLRREAEECSQPLLQPRPPLGVPVKDFLEGVLNAWKDDPSFYVRQSGVLDAAITNCSPAVRQELEQGRQRLVDLGIYRPAATGGGWELHSVRLGKAPVIERLTCYEVLELKRFHLLLLNQAILPGILVRKYSVNTVDQRLVQPQPYWFTFAAGTNATSRPSVVRRQTDPLFNAKPLEDP